MIAIPLFSQDRVMGVLAVYRNDPDRPFTQEDMDTVIFLAEQGGVAIENVQLHEEARRLSLMDGLTGIWNRRFLQMQFRQVLATATRFERPFSVLMLDLDFFKRINDTYGHQRGDAILIEFAHRVNGTLREIDTFARYGGEEFICLLSETDVEGARTTAEKICEVIRSEPFGAMGEEPIALTVSIGVASYPEHGNVLPNPGRGRRQGPLRSQRRRPQQGGGRSQGPILPAQARHVDSPHEGKEGSHPGRGSRDAVPAGDEIHPEGDDPGRRPTGDPVRGGGVRPRRHRGHPFHHEQREVGPRGPLRLVARARASARGEDGSSTS